MCRYKGSKGRKYEIGNICFLSFVHLSLMPYVDKICTYIYYLDIYTYIHTYRYIFNMKAEGNCMEVEIRPTRESRRNRR